MRAPDAAFVRRERVEALGVVTGYWPGPPDLVVEVISPNDRYTEVYEKVDEWLEAGVQYGGGGQSPKPHRYGSGRRDEPGYPA